MNRTVIAIGLLSTTCISFAQSWPEQSKEAKAYHEFRLARSTPSKGGAKAKALIAAIKPDKNNDDKVLADTIYQKLPFDEKFAYNMMHGEAFAQNCDAVPPIPDEQKKLFANLENCFEDEYRWSDRQIDFFKKNRTEVIKTLRKEIKKTGRVGSNYKLVLLEVDAVEAIPDLLQCYTKAPRDGDILTLFNLFMKEHKYEPFMKSPSYAKLYGENIPYWASLEASQANRDLIISRTKAFYKTIKSPR